MKNTEEGSEARRESRLRKRLQRQGYGLKKDRHQPSRDVNHQGGYMIVDPNLNTIIAGEKFNLTLDDVERFAMGDNQ